MHPLVLIVWTHVLSTHTCACSRTPTHLCSHTLPLYLLSFPLWHFLCVPVLTRLSQGITFPSHLTQLAWGGGLGRPWACDSVYSWDLK